MIPDTCLDRYLLMLQHRLVRTELILDDFITQKCVVLSLHLGQCIITFTSRECDAIK